MTGRRPSTALSSNAQGHDAPGHGQGAEKSSRHSDLCDLHKTLQPKHPLPLSSHVEAWGMRPVLAVGVSETLSMSRGCSSICGVFDLGLIPLKSLCQHKPLTVKEHTIRDRTITRTTSRPTTNASAKCKRLCAKSTVRSPKQMQQCSEHAPGPKLAFQSNCSKPPDCTWLCGESAAGMWVVHLLQGAVVGARLSQKRQPSLRCPHCFASFGHVLAGLADALAGALVDLSNTPLHQIKKKATQKNLQQKSTNGKISKLLPL